MAVDSLGNVYVADTLNSTIRKVTPAGVVTTLAGSPGTSGNVDGTGNEARFHSPYGIAVDRAANLYVADTWNHTIRKVTADRTVTTLAGLAGTAGLADGIGDAARFSFPTGVAADSEGSVFVADTYNNIIRKLTPVGTNWIVTTLSAWTGGAMLFDKPRGVALDGVGNLYVADYSKVISRGHSTTSSAIKIFDPGFNAGLFGFGFTAPLDRSVVVGSFHQSRELAAHWHQHHNGQ